MITDPDFPASILFTLDLPQTPEKHTIAPSRRALLLARVVVVRVDVVLVRGVKRDGRLGESAQPEARVLLTREQQLVALEEAREVLVFDVLDDGVAAHGVDAVVEVAVEDADLVVHNHAAVAAGCEDVRVRNSGVVGEWICREGLGFEDGCDVVVAVDGLGLSGGQMAVHEAQTAIVEDHAEDKRAFVAVQTAHAAFDFGCVDVFDPASEGALDEDAGEETDHA